MKTRKVFKTWMTENLRKPKGLLISLLDKDILVFWAVYFKVYSFQVF